MKIRDLQGDVAELAERVPGQATAGTAGEWALGVVPFRARVTSVTFAPEAAVTGAATNHFRLDVRNREDGAGSDDVAALAFDDGVDAAAWAATDIPLTDDVDVDEGDVLTVEKIVVGNGLAMPAGVVSVTLQAR